MSRESVSARAAARKGPSHYPGLVLSIFPGIDLLGRAFEHELFTVLRGPDLIWGGDIRGWSPPADVCEGIIGGSPCQDFSAARRSSPTGEGIQLLREFCRCVLDARPAWFILENTPRVPDVTVRGYTMQRFFLNALDCGCRQRRHRRFQFGSLDGVGLVIPPPLKSTMPAEACAMATEGTRKHRRTWADFCELQGLPRTFDIPGLSIEAKYAAVGNGVPIPMGRVLARAVRDRRVTRGTRVCVCGCGRVPPAAAQHFDAACRKRMERARRDLAAVTGPGSITPAESRRDGSKVDDSSSVTRDRAADRSPRTDTLFPDESEKTTAQDRDYALRTVTPEV